MNLGKTWSRHIFNKSYEVWKVDNVDIEIKYLSLLEKTNILKYFIFTFYIDKKKLKNMQIWNLTEKLF